jgi:hypothetical protein
MIQLFLVVVTIFSSLSSCTTQRVRYPKGVTADHFRGVIYKYQDGVMTSSRTVTVDPYVWPISKEN